MKSKVFKLTLLFLITLTTYVLVWLGMEHMRTKNGPWIVDFHSHTNRTSSLTINNHKSGVTNCVIEFTNTFDDLVINESVSFNDVNVEIPFGEFIYHDLMYLPGVVTLVVHGHEIEFLPRTLIINKQEKPWGSQPKFILEASTNSIPIDYTNVPNQEEKTAE